jgi:mycothiol synthase
MADDPAHETLRPAPPGFRLRRPGWDDLDRVVALHAAASRARTGAVTVRADDLRFRWLGLDSFDEALLVEPGATAADSDPDRVAPPDPVAYAAFESLVDPWTGELDLHVEGTVHPDWISHGLAGFLLARAEDHARVVARDAGRPGAVLRTSLEDGDERARAWFAERGFTPERHLLELRLDLHAPPPAAVWRSGVHYRTFRPGVDERVLWETHQAAFADVPTHLPLDLDDFLDDRLRRYPDLDPDLILLAEHDGAVVGLAICRAGTEVAAEDGWVRDLGVVPGWRRHGIGMALLRTAFAAFRARGLTGVALEVDDVTLDGAVALYRRAGMRTVRRTDVLERWLDIDADPVAV